MLLERGLPIADTPGGLGASIGARDGGLAFGNAGVVDGAELGDTMDLVLLVAAVGALDTARQLLAQMNEEPAT